ncbi:hypothetical protein TREMEDRAFT_44171 [Tremella mesenterica DSM 1558]|uniref:uncharacterized protein n=1 Tax=Tremella mesenterica (strain ATCC 24925 / CBS 8224 / DSM 1558 / NBRC 9311 / NRRL Y-6157 / RJB 2259-6 / UBC 559-6) TaxID=578456 RepID=UPI0003F49674|nr:uncharacterized protein TREMEDRAFT_44171 [Tremella mesenterica DSM 1558]EIW69702.1 hypothetical protein TREMEDRAFT_44171 [Tremella mesenterica DSM 1558]
MVALTDRQLDRLIMPAAMLLYLFSGLDKGNLGNAKTIGMVGEEGLGADPSGSKYALLNAFYFLGYALFLIPTTLFAKRTKMNIVLGCSGIVWGICASCTAAVNTYGQAEATRFLVGFGESGYGPVIPAYLAMWYTKRELALRITLFMCSGPISGFITGLIAYGVTFTHSRVEPWRLLFIIEGVPAIVAGLYALWILPGDLLITKRLTEKERACALVRIGRGGSHESHKINWKHALNTLISWQILLPAVTYQSIIVVGAAIGAFLPTLVADVGYTGAIAQVYTLPPYGTAAIVMLIVAWVSDRYGKRGPGMLLGMGMMSMGFAMLVGLKPDHHAGRYAALVFCETGQFITIPLNLTWVAENSGNGSRRAFALPFVIACAQALAIASGYMFPAKDKPVYHLGSSVCLSLTSLGFAVSLLYIFLLRRANAKKDAEEGPVDPTLVPDTATYADKARGFRYVW